MVSEDFRSRAQLFFHTLPGDKKLALAIAEFGAPALAERLALKGSLRSADSIIEEIQSHGAFFLTPEDLRWPRSLNDLIAPPIGLVIKGKISMDPKIAIVGTRNPTRYGLETTKRFSAGFVDHGWQIVSGGALGIDTAAHQCALDAGGSTIAILAGGVSLNYPASNFRLFEEIAATGALISEVMPTIHPRPERFLTRNRLIAALADATIVVEAAHRSGSIRTAHDAAELLKPVLAIPGPITSPTSDGCHQLISDRCAELVTSVADALSLIKPMSATS
jgi:DNA processing protein